MKRIFLLIVCLAVAISVQAADSPLDEQIKSDQTLLKTNPKNVQVLNHLAFLYTRKVRQSVDFSYNISAEKLVEQALSIDPKNYDSLLNLSIIYMAQHRFAEARDTAKKATAANPYGSGAFGILGDALYELGSYKECAKAYDQMGDLKPGAPYYSRVSSFRNVAGDPEGAISIMKEALDASDPSDLEDYSWYFLQLGNLSFDSGKTPNAETYYRESLKWNSSSYNAWAGLAKTQAAQGKLQDAIVSYQKAMAIVPMPDFAASLGDIYAVLGKPQEAERQYALVEYIGALSKVNQEIYNRQIAMFYADHDRKLDEALKLVQSEISVRKDIYGYDALAWCLYKNGKIAESVTAIRQALTMGTKDAKIFYHAGIIFSAAKQNAEAKKYLKMALSIQPHFHPLYAARAAQMVQKMEESARRG